MSEYHETRKLMLCSVPRGRDAPKPGILDPGAAHTCWFFLPADLALGGWPRVNSSI